MTENFPTSGHKVEWISVNKLSVVWRQAQRDLDERWAKTLADSFDPDLFNVLTVTLPNGSGIYHVIDGQHRVAAARTALGDNQKVPCNIFNITEPAQAARLFDKMNTSRKLPSSIAKFKVRVTAGNDIECEVNRVVIGCGYRIESSNADGVIRSPGTCVTVFKRFGASVLRAALRSISDTWGKDVNAVDSVLISGYALLFAEHDGHIDRTRLAERISKAFTPGKLLGSAKTAKELFGGSIPDGVAAVLTKTYNHGLRTGLLGEKPAKKKVSA